MLIFYIHHKRLNIWKRKYFFCFKGKYLIKNILLTNKKTWNHISATPYHRLANKFLETQQIWRRLALKILVWLLRYLETLYLKLITFGAVCLCNPSIELLMEHPWTVYIFEGMGQLFTKRSLKRSKWPWPWKDSWFYEK